MSLSTLITLLAFSQSLLIASVFFIRRRHHQGYFPLFLFFLANSVSYLGIIFDELGYYPVWQTAFEALGIAVEFLLPPTLFFFVRALTHNHSVQFSKKQWWHFFPFLIGLLTFALIVILPVEARIRLLDGPEVMAYTELAPGLLLILLFFVYPLQTMAYFIAIIRILISYRHRLRELYASTAKKELRWVGWIAFLFAFDWILSFATNLGEIFGYEGFYRDPADSVLDFVLFWLLAIWALRPMNSENHLQDNPLVPGQDISKYGRAALNPKRRITIAKKIEKAMQDKKLFLNPNLSLRKLAQTIGEKPNNVSQTLNVEFEKSFFDYVNGWRIREILVDILLAERTILAIAYDAGFNSKSSFYKAFKTETGLTPTTYRKTENLSQGDAIQLS